VTPFSLVKWYMDCVTGQGDTAILYCAHLRWRGAALSYSSVLCAGEHGVDSRSSMARFDLAVADNEIGVIFPCLKVSGCWQAAAPSYKQTVFESEAGSVEWNCLQPGSTVRVRIGARELVGLGYAECLTLTLPPWQLPMRQLRWGRFVSPEQTLAWIDWQGPFATSFAVHNGRRCELLSASEEEIVLSNATLRMEHSLPLRAGRLGATVLPAAPRLAKLLPRALRGIEEQKWRSQGVLQSEGNVSRGWVIHEVVHWNL